MAVRSLVTVGTLFMLVAPGAWAAAPARIATEIDRLAAEVEGDVIAWRRDIHAHPELSNRETRTAALVAAHLRSLGLEVRTGVARTGVVGTVRGGRPGPGGRAARRHGRAAGHGRGRPAVRAQATATYDGARRAA